MAAMEALASAYGDSDSDESGDAVVVTADHTAHLTSGSSIGDLKSKFNLNSAPLVAVKVSVYSAVNSVLVIELRLRDLL